MPLRPSPPGREQDHAEGSCGARTSVWTASHGGEKPEVLFQLREDERGYGTWKKFCREQTSKGGAECYDVPLWGRGIGGVTNRSFAMIRGLMMRRLDGKELFLRKRIQPLASDYRSCPTRLIAIPSDRVVPALEEPTCGYSTPPCATIA